VAAANVFDEIRGQAPAVETLVRGLRAGRVHHAYRFEGPEGVGKERAAFALAQSLVCERPPEGGGPGCGACAACRRAVRLAEEDPKVPQHPDVVLLERGLYPASALGTSTRETAAIGVEQVRRLVLSRVGFAPHEGRSLVFIVRDAEELSQQAANALLKTLEEPPSYVHFILLTSRPNRLLDTIRSRTLAVRFGPLPEEIVADVLERQGKDRTLSRHAAGSASVALELADEDVSRNRADFVRAAVDAIAAPELDAAIVFAGARPDDKDELRRNLLHLSAHFALEARDHVTAAPSRAHRAARRYSTVLRAIEAVDRNGQPALALEAMVARLRAD
jgi:DNA polymerase-3 subunit delta'